MNWLTKILLFPLSVLFGIGVSFRLWLYKHHFLGSTSFDLPVICVGNLSVGGTGKTPMIEFLARVFQQKYPLGILSRGYGRTTTGFLRVTPQHIAAQVGDEPLLLKLKNPAAEVAVGEERVMAIPKLLTEAPYVKVIVMDDGFQHLSVRPQVNILLTTFQQPFWQDHLLPMGTLREFVSGKERANIIVVTKCPRDLSAGQMQDCIKKIQPGENQKVFFSSLRYGDPYLLFGGQAPSPGTEKMIAITGIADASLFMEHIRPYDQVHFEFPDHHPYQLTGLQNILKNYPDRRSWITTEKDAVRLIPFRNWFLENGIALWVQPVAVEFLKNNGEDFAALMLQYLEYYYPQTVAPGTGQNDAE